MRIILVKPVFASMFYSMFTKHVLPTVAVGVSSLFPSRVLRRLTAGETD